MKNTIKALFATLAPVLVITVIFNVTVLRAFADSKKMEQAKIARIALENVNRSPAVLASK